MMNKENNKTIIKEKLDFFLKNNIKIHITKTNREFLNGPLIKKESEEIYLIKEKNKGIIRIFISEVFDVEEFKEAKNDKNK